MTNPFAANDIADNLNLLQQLAVTVAEQQNQHVDEFNHAIGTIESLEQQLAALRTELDNQKALNVKIHEDRLAILNKHNESVNTANSEIRRLQTRSAEAELQLSELRKIDPERMKRLYEAQKEHKHIYELLKDGSLDEVQKFNIYHLQTSMDSMRKQLKLYNA